MFPPLLFFFARLQPDYRCSGKFVAPENNSHMQQYGLRLRLGIGLKLGLWSGLGVVHKWRHAILRKNLPPTPFVTLRRTFLDPFKYDVTNAYPRQPVV